jgi:3-oxoacyl-[acyl-carrier protein] reductase
MLNSDRVAVITGAASGIGLAVAERLSQSLQDVILVDRSDKVLEVAEQLRSNERRAHAKVLDLADLDSLPAFVKEVGERHGRLDILVNNAGIHPKKNGMPYLIEEIDTAQWLHVMNVNLTSAFVLSREAFGLMKAKKFGRIVNISSRGGRMYSPQAGIHYHASKSGMFGLTRVLAGEGGPCGITANCIAPGRVRTPLGNEGVGEQHHSNYASNVPVGRVGHTTEIAAAVEYLCSEEAGYTSGAIIDVNGGGYMA